MALIKCTECGKEISSEAESCPNCGKPSSVMHCPVCKSTNVQRVKTPTALLLANLFVAGPMAKRPKQFYCGNCKYSW